MNRNEREHDIRNRASISTYVHKGHRPLSEKSLAELAAHGLTRVELWESPEQYNFTRGDSMKHVFADCRAAGVEICAWHASATDLSDIGTPEARAAGVDRCRRQIDNMLAGGAKTWGSHIRGLDGDAEACLCELLGHVEGTGAVIVIENFNRDGCRLGDRLAAIERIGHPQLGLVLDVGHVRNQQGENPMTLPGGPAEIIGRCGEKLRFLHLHGFVETDHYPPFCEGDRIQWAEIFRALYAQDYRGYFNFEPKGEAFHRNTLELTARAPAAIAAQLHEERQ